jgi:putative inorganic carbon (hco3(-)) transporter
LRIWSDGLLLMRASPVFGIGMLKFGQEVGLVAHNSFVQCFVELGIFGGTLFVGAFYLALWQPWHVQRTANHGARRSDLQRFQPFLMAIVVGTIVGMFSCTRSYEIPTYLILGLTAAYVRLLADQSGARVASLNWALARRITLISLAVLIFTHIYVRIAVRF